MWGGTWVQFLCLTITSTISDYWLFLVQEYNLKLCPRTILSDLSGLGVGVCIGDVGLTLKGMYGEGPACGLIVVTWLPPQHTPLWPTAHPTLTNSTHSCDTQDTSLRWLQTSLRPKAQICDPYHIPHRHKSHMYTMKNSLRSTACPSLTSSIPYFK